MSRAVERRALSCEEIVKDCLDRIHEKNGKLNALVAVFEEDALRSAREADAARSRAERKSAIDGLPVSVKENIDLTGRPATLGIVARKDRIASRDAGIVRALRRAGAVIVGQGNVPQLLLSHETRNPLHGFTLNAFSDAHAPGGSSGGEATAVASGMVPLAIGTDIGGSIRVPAHFSGITGFKPSLDRWSNLGSNGALTGQEVIRSQLGPMARTVSDLVLAFGALDARSMSADDPMVPPLPFVALPEDEIVKLRIGVFVNDGFLPPSHAVERGVGEAASSLRKLGFEVATFEPPNVPDAVRLYFSLMSADGGETAWGQLEGTAVEPTLLPLKRTASLPASVRHGLARAMSLAGEKRTALLLDAVGARTVAEVWKLTYEARAARLKFLAAMQEQRVDVLLCPAHATPAIPHTLSGDFVAAASYSMLFNLFQFPAGVVPVTTVRADDIGPARAASTGGRRDRFDKKAKRIDDASLGLPVGVQVVSRPFMDAAVLGVMGALEQAIVHHPDRPRVPVT